MDVFNSTGASLAAVAAIVLLGMGIAGNKRIKIVPVILLIVVASSIGLFIDAGDITTGLIRVALVLAAVAVIALLAWIAGIVIGASDVSKRKARGMFIWMAILAVMTTVVGMISVFEVDWGSLLDAVLPKASAGISAPWLIFVIIGAILLFMGAIRKIRKRSYGCKSLPAEWNLPTVFQSSTTRLTSARVLRSR